MTQADILDRQPPPMDRGGTTYDRDRDFERAARRENRQEFYAWVNMKTRCTNPNYYLWHRYGGRGIKVCERWRRSFLAFLADVGRKPFSTAMLDRIDNNGNYEPGNVRWVDRIENSRNRNCVRSITARGKTMTLPEWEEESGRSRKIIWRRLKDGWPAELAIYGDPMPHHLRHRKNPIMEHWSNYQFAQHAFPAARWTGNTSGVGYGGTG